MSSSTRWLVASVSTASCGRQSLALVALEDRRQAVALNLPLGQGHPFPAQPPISRS
jgi:hypothetical protein